MPQTTLALLAMIVATLFSIQQQKNAMFGQIAMIRNEVEGLATSVAEEKLERISGEAFDQNTKGSASVSSVNDLTLEANFSDSQKDDIDDFDNLSETVTRTVRGHDFTFRLRADVDYVRASALSDTLTNETVRTAYKRVEVRVSSMNPDRMVSLAGTLRLARVFSCGSDCS